MTINERLEELLDQKDQEITKLSTELEDLKDKTRAEAWKWAIHTESLELEGLPVPRLEIRYKRTGLACYEWISALVYKHLTKVVIKVPLGHTKVDRICGVNFVPVSRGEPELPFRDGAHVVSDSMELNLPLFAIVDDMVWQAFISKPNVYWRRWVAVQAAVTAETTQPRKVKAVGDVICLGAHDLQEQYIGWKCTRCGHSQIFAAWEGLDDEYSDDEEEWPDDN